MIEIYGKTACPHCDAAKKLCEMKNIEYRIPIFNLMLTLLVTKC